MCELIRQSICAFPEIPGKNVFVQIKRNTDFGKIKRSLGAADKQVYELNLDTLSEKHHRLSISIYEKRYEYCVP